MENQKNFCLTKIIRAKLANGKILTFISQRRIFFKNNEISNKIHNLTLSFYNCNLVYLKMYSEYFNGFWMKK